ncbi:Calx-beta domain-containing protein [Maribacter sp. ACAM166]|uniref:Calx-beta domain-containing protein n=1 Tax=Maribacter sp. ACAM166 TaxID=2508996 RepID=UPI002018247E|nr:Calx-beta domain-containing protein [Maribacter sp. ACAM166]
MDRFNNVSYSNNNGTQNFNGNWVEYDDDNSPSGGKVDINSNKLRFKKLKGESIGRRVNLAGASSVVFTMNYDANNRGNQSLGVYIYNFSNNNFNLIQDLNSNNTGTVSYTLSAAEIASNPGVYFASTSDKWDKKDEIFVDNVQFSATFGPTITINDITITEDAGSAIFTATSGGSASGSSFTVDYQTVDDTATSGSDYTAITGTMTFNGNVGDTETITVPILDDVALENVETFNIQMTSTSNLSADISDTATGTVIDDDSIIMTNGSNSNECGTVFLDPGGLNNYGNNQNITHTLCPKMGTDYVTVDFTSFDVEAGFDFLYIYDGNSTGAALIGQYDNNNVPTTITASAGGSGCLTFRFTSDNNVNGAGFQADIKCYQEGPRIVIDDVSVDEDAGIAVFTVTSTRARHGRTVPITGFVNTQFNVNYTTTNGSALAGSDYTATTSTLTFSGAIGNQRTISVPISNDGIPESAENFFVEFTGVNAPDAQVNFDDTGIGTINSQILANDPLTLIKEFDGEFDYTSTGGTLRTESNDGNACAITTSSSNTLTSPIPNTGTVAAAYLYWVHSSFNRDEQVIFEGQTVNASFVYQSTLTNRNFYGYVSDVTNLVQGVANISTNVFDFSGLSIDTNNPYCNSATVLGGWSLIVFYEDPNLSAVNINLYQGFDGLSNEGTSFTLDSFYAIAGSGAKATFLSWEGDDTLDGNTGTNPEALSITNQGGITFNLTGDGGNPGNNAYNSTIYDNTIAPVYNTQNIYGVDLDTYDISNFITPGDTQITANVDMGQDFVINMAVVLKVPSNLIAGSVFEDINYPGGNGRNNVVSLGVGVSGATVELFESNGTFVERKITDVNGDYSFGGMQDGDYLIKVVNSTVSSTRGGGLNCNDCFPVQTFRSFGDATAITEVTTEVGGADPSATLDAALGILTNAQSVSSASVASNGVTGVDFGFNFNTIVNTNKNGQGSLEQFILNSNNLDETGLDVEANSLFDPVAGEDISIFMIPPTSDTFGRTADANFANGYFDILMSIGNPLSIIIGDKTIIDGRTQTAYSGDTNTGVLGSGGSTVGVSNIMLPNYNRPEIQVHSVAGDVFRTEANNVGIRNLSIFAANNSGIRVDAGSVSVNRNIIGLDATGITGNDLNIGIENVGGDINIDGNYIANAGDYAISIDGGSSNIIQNNHLANNGIAACDDAILLTGGTGIQVLQNLIQTSASTAIDGETSSGGVIISENSITTSGQDGGDCSGSPQQMAIKLAGDGSEIANNKIYSNGGAGISIIGGISNRISQNSIYANGTAGDALGIDLNDDGVTINDLADGDSGPNGLENFPVVSGAYVAGNTLVVNGWAAPGITVEVFFTDINEGTSTLGDNKLGLTQDYGEGQIYIGSAVEGSASDQDSSSSPYTDVDGNTDNTNRYKFEFPLPPGTVIGNQITTTGTRSNSTSEFSPMIEIKAYTVITNWRITYRVKTN